MDVRKAVIPAAGLGTRFLPATKTVPKEMLPIVDKPAIQWVVEEILAAGIQEVVFITGRGKGAIIDHFDFTYELEDRLARAGKESLLRTARRASRMIRTIGVRQKEPLGLGHAVLCARAAIGDEPFAVLLPDDLFEAREPAIGQLIAVHERTKKGVVGLLEVPRGETRKYGIISGEEIEERIYRIDDLIEKPDPAEAPSTLAIPGRYVLPSRIFDYLEETEPGHGGEIQLTDALARLAHGEGLNGLVLEAVRHDTGNVLGYLKANISFALKRDDLAPDLLTYLRGLLEAAD